MQGWRAGDLARQPFSRQPNTHIPPAASITQLLLPITGLSPPSTLLVLSYCHSQFRTGLPPESKNQIHRNANQDQPDSCQGIARLA